MGFVPDKNIPLRCIPKKCAVSRQMGKKEEAREIFDNRSMSAML